MDRLGQPLAFTLLIAGLASACQPPDPPTGATCPADRTVCAAACVEIAIDPLNCGACGVLCGAGEQCVDAACQLVCGGGALACEEQCIDPLNDPRHCGACGVGCSEFEVCQAGACASHCAGGSTDCSGACVDTDNDPRHCGACDTVCAAGEVCSDGGCALVCSGGASRCGARCVNTENDAQNCGACDNACAGEERCRSGQCELNCSAPTSACEGRCVNTDNDPQNCGACAQACADGEACFAGACRNSGCAQGTELCGETCVATDHDPAHCGACDNACPQPPQGRALCGDGVCYAVCLPGFGDCNGDPVDGCELDLEGDPLHCGACGNACAPRPNALAGCTDGACDMGQCSAGFGNCDEAPENGCEVEFGEDADNCGACGNACAGGSRCLAGACVDTPLACSAGANLVATSPGADMVVCDHPGDNVCEQDAETLCPQGWGLCSRTQYINRNDGWAANPGGVIVGEIYCRPGAGAGHFTLGPYGGFANLSTDIPFQCGYGSSRPACTSAYGCNETHVNALCCSPTPTCGNGQTDAPEEECDDANLSENDDCLNSCAWRVPSQHGVNGC
jgi:hypothetical protein